MARVRSVTRGLTPALYIATRPALCTSALVCLLTMGCGSGQQGAAPEAVTPAPAAAGAIVAGPGEQLVPVPTAESNREILRVNLDDVEFRPADPSNDLGIGWVG